MRPYESNRLNAVDGEPICRIIRMIIGKGRFISEEDVIADDTMFVKTKELK